MNRNKEVSYLKFKKVNDQEKIFFFLTKWFFLVGKTTISVKTKNSFFYVSPGTSFDDKFCYFV